MIGIITFFLPLKVVLGHCSDEAGDVPNHFRRRQTREAEHLHVVVVVGTTLVGGGKSLGGGEVMRQASALLLISY